MPPSDAVLPDHSADFPDRSRRPTPGDDFQVAIYDAVRRTPSRVVGERPVRDRPWVVVRGGPLADPPSDALPELVERLAELRATVWSYVRRRRDAGTPVQRVLPEVKALVREALALEGATGVWSHDAAELLTEPVVRWAIAAYYAVHAELRAEPSCDARVQRGR